MKMLVASAFAICLGFAAISAIEGDAAGSARPGGLGRRDPRRRRLRSRLASRSLWRMPPDV